MAEVPKILEDPLRTSVDLVHRKIVYPYLTRSAQSDREIAHDRALDLMEKAQSNKLLLSLFSKVFTYRDSILKTKLGTAISPNPLGIAAGFDKNGRVHNFLGEALGFGFIKGGSLTKLDYSGNPRPRIFDLPNNDGLINRMGFLGEGTQKAKERLRKSYGYRRNYLLILNVAASRPSFDRGTQIEDYVDAYFDLLPFADAMEINISSPNTPGVRGLQEPEVFKDLAQAIAKKRKGEPFGSIPLIYKFGPDLTLENLEKDLKIAADYGADGVTLTNTSVDQSLRDSLKPDRYKNEAGGMSGALLAERSLWATSTAFKYLGEKMFIIRSGGVRGSAQDLWQSLTFGGATAAEAYASFVRPNTSTLNFTVYALRDFAKAMRAEGMTSMDDFKDLRGKKIPFPKI